ncbi:MAG: hypothetical protein HQL73_11585, partial [Magnetococcales bacterium]|nr:hypothetical protein [Magnetococcales bacterium]
MNLTVNAITFSHKYRRFAERPLLVMLQLIVILLVSVWTIPLAADSIGKIKSEFLHPGIDFELEDNSPNPWAEEQNQADSKKEADRQYDQKKALEKEDEERRLKRDLEKRQDQRRQQIENYRKKQENKSQDRQFFNKQNEEQ